MKQLYFFIAFFSFTIHSFGQVGINTTTPNAQLEIKSSNQATPANTDGIMIPKADAFPAINPTAAQDGMMVYLTQNVGVNQPGFYYWQNSTSTWKSVSGIAAEIDPQVSSSTTNTIPKYNGTTLVDGLMVDDGTNVGVGITPTAGNRLEVAGKTKTTNLQMTTGATANYVLQSDAIGNGSWVNPSLLQTSDWYKESTTTPPTAITDDMYHTGNIAIGKTTANFPLDISNINNDFGLYLNSSFSTNGSKAAIYNIVDANSVAVGELSGINTIISGSTQTVLTANVSQISNSGNGSHYANYSSLYGTGSGPHYTNYNNLSGSGTGDQIANNSNISNTGNATHYANFNQLSGEGSGEHYANYSSLFGTGTGDQYGNSTTISNTGNATHYGNRNLLVGTGSGTHYANYSILSGSGSGEQIGNYSEISNTSNFFATHTANKSVLNGSGKGTHFGNFIDLTGIGIGNQFGDYIRITNSGNGIHIGSDISLNSNGSGPHKARSSSLSGNCAGEQIIDDSTISSSGNSNHFGNRIRLDGNGSGYHYGDYIVLSGSGSGVQIGTETTISNSSNGIHSGNWTTMNGSGSGNHYANYSDLGDIGSGDQIANYSKISNAGNGIHNGIKNELFGSGSGNHFANHSTLSGLGTGNQTCIYNSITNSKDGIHYGVYTNLSGIGLGTKYGNYTIINPSTGGTHYGSYNEVLKTGSFAGYFLGNVAIGVSSASTYILPTVRGTANQIIQTDGSGNATWVNPSTLTVTETDPQVSSATTNSLPKWNGTTLVDGIILDNGTKVGVGTNNPSAKLEVTSTGTSEVRISSTSAFGPSRLSMYSDKDIPNEWRPAYIESGDNGTFTGRLDFFTNGTGSANKLGAVLAMSAVDGKVGIGTINPTKAKLEVSGFVANQPQSCFAFYARSGACNGSPATGSSNGITNYSIYASDRIMASEFNAFSDKRIKNNFNASNPATDLAILNKLRVTNYNHIDTANKGTDAKKGFIAQEVKEVFPEAVSQTKEFIPNVYQVAKSSILKGTSLIVTLDKNHDLKVGDKIRLIADKQADYTITKTSENTFEVENYDQTTQSIFVFGKEVSDFHVVDYDRIFTLGISAIQQLTKENETQKLEIESLKKELVNSNLEILKRLEKLEKK